MQEKGNLSINSENFMPIIKNGSIQIRTSSFVNWYPMRVMR